MGSRKVISESQVIAAHERGDTKLVVPVDSLVTPLAVDTAKARKIAIVKQDAPLVAAATADSSSNRAVDNKVVAVGADHGGFELKQVLSKKIQSMGYTVLDVGTHSTARCDYPDFAFAVARAISYGKASRGVMIDGAGPGSAIVCNKVPGIRAACAYNEFAAWNARAHNDCNVLTLGSRVTGVGVCDRIIETFLSTDFEGGRHQARVDKIADIEAHFGVDR